MSILVRIIGGGNWGFRGDKFGFAAMRKDKFEARRDMKLIDKRQEILSTKCPTFAGSAKSGNKAR